MMWFHGKERIIKEMWRSGLSASQIAKVFNVTKNAVIRRVTNMGLTGQDKLPKPSKKGYIDVSNYDHCWEPMGTGHVKLLDLKPYHCRWPLDNGSGEAVFCGCTKVDKSSYCQFHKEMSGARK